MTNPPPSVPIYYPYSELTRTLDRMDSPPPSSCPFNISNQHTISLTHPPFQCPFFPPILSIVWIYQQHPPSFSPSLSTFPLSTYLTHFSVSYSLLHLYTFTPTTTDYQYREDYRQYPPTLSYFPFVLISFPLFLVPQFLHVHPYNLSVPCGFIVNLAETNWLCC